MLRTATVLICTALLGALTPAASAQAAASWSVSPAEYDFAPRLIGTGPSAPMVFNLTNTGSEALRAPTIGGFGRIIGGEGGGEPNNSGVFRPTVGCTGEIAPGASCPIEVTFEPTAIGQVGVFIGLDEPEGKVPFVYLLVRGSAAVPAIKFSPGGIFFPSRLLGIELNPPVPFTVTNTGTADLHISDISLINVGTNPVNPNQIKVVGGSCGSAITLPVAGSCTIQMTYTPTLVGAVTGELQFTDDVPERRPGHVGLLTPGTQTVPIRGMGVSSAGPPVAQDVAIVGHPPARSHRTWARFRFVVPDARPAFLCRLDAAPYRPCASPVTYRHLTPGRHVFRVRPATAGPTVSGLAAVQRFRVLPAARHR